MAMSLLEAGRAPLPVPQGEWPRGVLEAVLASSNDAFIHCDLDSRVRMWSCGAERMLGHSRETMVGASVLAIVPEDRHAEHRGIIDSVRQGRPVAPFDTMRRAADGRLVDVSMSVVAIPGADGAPAGAVAVLRDIGALKQRERELLRISNLYSALSLINQAIVGGMQTDDLLQHVCQVLVEAGGFQAAWIGWHDEATRLFRPAAAHSRGTSVAEYLEGLVVASDDRPEGQGPCGIAWRSNDIHICNDNMSDPLMLPWRQRAAAQGWRASAAVPIHRRGVPCALLSVYAGEPDVLQEKEIALLRSAARDVSLGLDVIANDIERRRSEAIIRAERDFSEAVVDGIPAIFVLYNERRELVRWNRRFADLTGITREDAAERRIADALLEADRASAMEAIDRAYRCGKATAEARVVARDGRVIPHFFTGVRTEIAGQTCMISVGIDITRLKEAQTAARDAEEGRRLAEAELARVTRIATVGEFVASIAHEINQPLAAVVTSADALRRWIDREPPNVAEAREAAARIGRNALRASDVVGRLRALLARNTGAYARFAVNDAVQEILDLMAPAFARQGVSVLPQLGDALPDAFGDRVQVQQVMLNLCANALDAMKGMECRRQELRLRTSCDGAGDLVLEVEDTGTGVDAEVAPRIFEQFFSTKEGGMGLGLAIVRTIVERHGGRISVAPATPSGTTFTVVLPSAGSRT